jgi:tRNA threonylcarbamoyladenosine biosynthesis protein TsaE
LFPWTVETRSPEQTRALGEAFGRLLGPSAVVLLSGDLGAGKTCFTQGLGRGLEVPAAEPVVSPSYTLMNQYRGRLDLYHFDLYRLAHAEDLVDLGFDEYLYGTGVTVVEWGDRFPDLGRDAIRVCLEHGGGEHRRICFSAEGAANRLLIEVLQRQWVAEGERDDRV